MPRLSPPPLTSDSLLRTTARTKPTALTPSPPGVPSPLPPPHKLELQTLKLEELTVSVGSNFPGWPSPSVGTHRSNPAASAPSETQEPGCPVPAFQMSSPSSRLRPGTLPARPLPAPPPQVSELRQQLRLRGLPVSGTKSILLERMRSGALPRERSKPRRDDRPACAPWPRLRPKALGAVRRQGSVRAGLRAYGPVRRRQSGMGREVDRRIANEVRVAWLRLPNGRIIREENPMKDYGAMPEGGGRPASAGPGDQGVEPQLRMGGIAPGGRGIWERFFAVLA